MDEKPPHPSPLSNLLNGGGQRQATPNLVSRRPKLQMAARREEDPVPCLEDDSIIELPDMGGNERVPPMYPGVNPLPGMHSMSQFSSANYNMAENFHSSFSQPSFGNNDFNMYSYGASSQSQSFAGPTSYNQSPYGDLNAFTSMMMTHSIPALDGPSTSGNPNTSMSSAPRTATFTLGPEANG